MTDPATLRALAARVMAGTATNEEVATALEWRIQSDPIDGAYWVSYDTGDWFKTLPLFLTSLDAADLLMAPLRERGWRTRGGEAIAGGWYAVANHKRLAGPPICFAPTGPRARTALALLCRAVELEHADADQR